MLQAMTAPTKIRYLAATGLFAVFLINIVTPPDFVIDILYLCSIVLIFKQNTRTIIGFGLAACILIVVNALFFDTEVERSMSLWINRGISVFAIVITTYIAAHYRKQTQAGIRREHQYLRALEAMLFMTSHQVRKPVANILGLVETMNNDCDHLLANDIHEFCIHLKSSANELDAFVKELNAFIEQTEEDHNRGLIEY
jgi:signal transduction histidine kinase